MGVAEVALLVPVRYTKLIIHLSQSLADLGPAQTRGGGFSLPLAFDKKQQLQSCHEAG